MLNQPQDFELRLVDGAYAVYVSGTLCRFAAPASTPKRAKLYTVAQGSSLIYVGIATRRMSERLTYDGFKAAA